MVEARTQTVAQVSKAGRTTMGGSMQDMENGWNQKTWPILALQNQ